VGRRERVTLQVRALDLDDPRDVALGRSLVDEYVVFTAHEARDAGMYDVDLPTLHEIIPDLRDFAGRYRTGAYLVASNDRTVAGGVGITRVDDRTCEMNRLWLRAAHRGNGAGRALVAACLAHGRDELGFRKMVLDVAPYRSGAIALYRSFGFADVEAIHEYPFDMIALARDL
jgi:ribosomal protein S18 acetylase RimI-like enzyme